MMVVFLCANAFWILTCLAGMSAIDGKSVARMKK